MQADWGETVMRLRLRNLLVEPRAVVISSDAHEAVVLVDGLVCDFICERRVAAALRGLPEVEHVGHVWGSDEFVIRSRLGSLETRAVDAAVQRVVTLRLVRRLLARLSRTTKPHNQGL